MKIGIKTFDSKEFAEYFKDKVDFLEVMAIEGKDYSFLDDYSLPIVIHSQHQKFGINFADKSIRDRNLNSINFAIKLANLYDAKKIILHPGILFDINCSIDESINQIKLLDQRVIIENLPKNKREINPICPTAEETKDFLNKTNRKLCFDINHAISTALTEKKDYFQIIKDFIKLNPVHYHLGGQSLEKDWSHLSFKESTIPLKEILLLLPKDAEITLETTTDIKKTENDLKTVRKLIQSIS